MTTVAEVTSTPTSEYKVIVVGNANAWPMTWDRWLRAKREKSGIFSETVAQKSDRRVQRGNQELEELREAGEVRRR